MQHLGSTLHVLPVRQRPPRRTTMLPGRTKKSRQIALKCSLGEVVVLVGGGLGGPGCILERFGGFVLEAPGNIAVQRHRV